MIVEIVILEEEINRREVNNELQGTPAIVRPINTATYMDNAIMLRRIVQWFNPRRKSMIKRNRKMQGFTYATCLDLNRGYYHFELDEESKHLCGIILPWGRYIYNRLPQGCKPSSDIFQEYMTRIFNPFEDVLVFIDNILLYTKGTFDHHVDRLNSVLYVIQTHNLHVHVEDTYLAAQQVNYLGYTLTTKGIKPQSKKIVSLLAFAEPKNKRMCKSFLGFVTYYKKLWYHRSHILEPITKISGAKAQFIWGPDQRRAFSEMKQTMARQVLLAFPDFDKPFEVYTDASHYQLGGVICQDGNPIAFYSRKLNPAQRNYTTMEKELLSIIETIENHRNILLGFQIRIYSDHKNLSFTNFKSERVLRWRLLLEEYDYKFYYKPGKDNFIADMLSRYPMMEIPKNSIEQMNVMEVKEMFPLNLNTIAKYQQKEQDDGIDYSKYYIKTINNLKLFHYKTKIIIPNILLSHMIEWYHTYLQHPGITKTYKTIMCYFWHQNLKQSIIQHIKQCEGCRHKRTGPKYGKLPLAQDTLSLPWEVMQVDLFGPWTIDNNYVTITIKGKQKVVPLTIHAVSMIDPATKWIELHPIDEYGASSENVAMIVDREWFCRYPRPSTVIFDNGSEFTSEWLDLLESYGIKAKPTTVKNPQANAVVERIHLTIGDSLRAQQLGNQKLNKDNIYAILQATAFGLRSAYHSALNASPAQVTFGRDMIYNIKYLANWKYINKMKRARMIKDNKKENDRRVNHTYHIGDMVYLIDKDIKRKLTTKKGPYPIIALYNNGTARLQKSPNVTEVINLRRLDPTFN